jgi:peptidoglycan/xylan/chitin deacetylase (PgdA/CDA1 family)
MSSAELLNSNPVDLNRNRRFFLSFDDGLSEIYHTIAPILMEKGIPATFFLNTDFIDNKDLFYRLKTSILIEKIIEEGISDSQKRAISHLLKIIGINYNLPKDLLKIDYQTKEVLEEIAAVVNVDFKEYSKEKSPYLTTTEIKSLINQGFNIGAHSCSHPFYFLISEEDQVSETLNSISFLKEKFNVAVNMFAFPYTDFEVKKSFFEKISSEVALSFGTASLKLDTVSTNFQRIPMERKNSAEEILKEEYLLFILKKLVNKHQIIRH